MSGAFIVRVLARAVSISLVGLVAFLIVRDTVRPTFEDVEAYWQAGLRLRTGMPLYVPATDPLGADVYRYAPWFAWLWAPLTLLPRTLVTIAWEVVLLGSVVFVLRRIGMARGEAGLTAVIFFAPLLLDTALGGNVHALMIAVLLWGIDRRSAPLWIAAAATLKVVPIVLCLVYAGRRQWGRLAATLLLTALLAAPVLFYDLSGYSTEAGEVVLTWGTPLYLPLVVISSLATWWLAATRFGWLAAGTTALVALPRVWPYDLTLLLIGMAAEPNSSRSGVSWFSSSRAWLSERGFGTSSSRPISR